MVHPKFRLKFSVLESSNAQRIGWDFLLEHITVP